MTHDGVGVKVFPIIGSDVMMSPSALVSQSVDMINRYGKGGTFWQTGQPGAPYANKNLEVDWIEWINEPYGYNMGGANQGLAAAPRYAALTKSAYQQFKATAQGKKVKVGVAFDLSYFASSGDIGNWIVDMVQGAGGVAGTPDYFTSGGYYDAITIHPYAWINCTQTNRWCFHRVKEIISRIDQQDGNSNAHKKEIWFTEDGAATADQMTIIPQQISLMQTDPVLKTLPVRGWSWHHYRDYTGWDQGWTVDGTPGTTKPVFDWFRDNIAPKTPPHNYEGQ